MKKHVCAVALFCLFVASSCWAAETIPFMRIYRDYSSNPFKAERAWVGKRICVEGKIAGLGKNVNDGPTVILVDPYGDLSVVYYFGFTGTVPDRLYDVEEGQEVKLEGRVFELEKRKGQDFLSVWVDYAQFAD